MQSFVFTGGHHNSALVLAQYMAKNGHTVYWYGHKRSSRGDLNDSAEYQEVTASQISFFDLPAGRATLSLTEILKIPGGFMHALKLLRLHKPSAVISFGGYLGATTALAAALMGIPVFLHEQTVVAGKANRLIGKVARRVYLTWDSSRQFFPAKKTLLVGLPLRTSILDAKVKKFFSRKRPTLLVMGGKQGAHVINTFIFNNLSGLLHHFNIIHQTGTSSETKDYDRALDLQKNLGSLSDCYLPLGYINEVEIGTYLKSADYYLGRSGAHIIYELMLMELKSVLVPLPSTHKSEQLKNAEELLALKQGIIFNQSELELNKVVAGVMSLAESRPVKSNLPDDATKRIYDDIQSCL